jgi:hypothetical protein
MTNIINEFGYYIEEGLARRAACCGAGWTDDEASPTMTDDMATSSGIRYVRWIGDTSLL